MISLEEYKKHLIDNYVHEIDNTNERRAAREEILEKEYGDFQLLRIINDTYSFVMSVLESDTLKHGYYEFPIDYDTTDYINLNLVGGWHSDTLFMDSRKRVISKYILKKVFGNYLDISVREEINEHEEDDIVGFDYDYYIYMQGFPKNLDEVKEKYGNYQIKVLFIDFDGVLHSMNDIDEDKDVVRGYVEKRIKILADIARIYNCKIVIESGGKTNIDEQTLKIRPDAEYVKNMFAMFKKYNIECIGRTPEVPIYENMGYTFYKGVEIRKYLFRHPEIAHYCILDDDDTINLFHWKHSDLEPVQDHLVRPLYYSKEHPEETCIQYGHMSEIGEALKKENTIRKLALKREPKNYFID